MDHEDAQLRVQTNNPKDAVDRIALFTQPEDMSNEQIDSGRVFLNDRGILIGIYWRIFLSG